MDEKYYVKKETYSHGDLFELIDTTTFYVFKEGKIKPIYTFIGEFYADLENGIWVKTGANGVSNVEIIDNGKKLSVSYYDKEKIIIPFN